MESFAAILTGDLVNSTQAPVQTVDATMQRIATTAALIDEDTRFTRFRGDGWQIYLRNAGQCLSVCLLILARLKASDGSLSTRISVGMGEIYPLPDGDLSAASGPAFIASGRGLDDMAAAQTLSIKGQGVDVFQQSIFAFAADRAARWSREQAEAMALALNPDMPNRTAIATQLGISRQAVDARLAAAGHRLLEQASIAFVERYTPLNWENSDA